MNRMVHILAAGRAAIADSGNAGTNAVTITRVALGSGLAPAEADDDARAALRIQRNIAPASGVPAVAGDIAVRADIDPTANYAVTEVGLFARIGAGPEFLFAYWAATAAGDAIAAAQSGGARITIAAVVRVSGSAAEVNVTAAPNITIVQGADTGDIKATAAINIPAGWLECNGAAVSRADYAALYAAIGTAYGAGDGATTFNLPDFRGRTIIGSGDGGDSLTNRSRGDEGGAETHALTEAELPAHDHDSGTLTADSAGAHTHDMAAWEREGGARGSGGGKSSSSFADTESAGAHSHDISGSTATAGGGAAHENMQPYGVARLVIKT